MNSCYFYFSLVKHIIQHLSTFHSHSIVNNCWSSAIYFSWSSASLYQGISHYSIYRLIHGGFHIGLVIIMRPPYWPETQSRANMGRGMITRPIWKCPCIKLFITYFRHLEKRHPYCPETKSRLILARTNMGLDMEMIL